MIIPVRCFNCGKVIAEIAEQYYEKLEQLERNEAVMIDSGQSTGSDGNRPDEQQRQSNEAAVLDSLGVHRYCCRRMIISHVDMMEKLLRFNPQDRREFMAALREREEREKQERLAQEAAQGNR